jgi:hypothetical protein
LQHYVAALSFAALGVNTSAARWPFALLGWAVLIINYAMLREITQNRLLSRYATALLLASVPFLLHARQCRYYTLLALFALLHIWGYRRLTKQAPRAAWLFIGGGIGLYHSFFPQLAASTIAMAAHAFVFHRNRIFLRRFAIQSGVIAIACLPFFAYTQGWSRNYGGSGYGFDDLGRYLATLRAYLLQVHVYCWPVLLALPLAWKFTARKHAPKRKSYATKLTALALLYLLALAVPPSPGSFAVMSIVVAVAGFDLTRWVSTNPARNWMREEVALLALLLSVSVLLFAGICNYPFFRYLVGILPLFAVATAATVIALGAGNKWVTALIAACLVFSNLVQQGPFALIAGWVEALGLGSRVQFVSDYGYRPSNLSSYQSLGLQNAAPRFRSLLWEYAHELTHDYLGPVGAAVRYLQEHAHPDETLLTTYEHFPLIFYTNLHVYQTKSGSNLVELPNWVFIHGSQEAPPSEHLAQALRDPNQYLEINIAAHEFAFENIPEPNWHQFRTPTEGPLIGLFRRVN